MEAFKLKSSRLQSFQDINFPNSDIFKLKVNHIWKLSSYKALDFKAFKLLIFQIRIFKLEVNHIWKISSYKALEFKAFKLLSSKI